MLSYVAGVLRATVNDAIASVTMRVPCPSCQIEYDVPDAALTGRARTVRCSNCMTKWKVPALEMYRKPETPDLEPVTAPQIADEPEPDLDPSADRDDTPEPIADEAMAEPVEAEPAPQPELGQPARPSVLTASKDAEPSPVMHEPPLMRISLLLLLLIIVLVLAEHRAISNLWPPSARLFNALGLT